MPIAWTASQRATRLHTSSRNIARESVRRPFSDAPFAFGKHEFENSDVLDYLKHQAGERIRGLDDTTRNSLRKTLSEAYERREGWAQWLGRVKRVVDCSQPKNRADMIVRTEMAYAYNVSLLHTYRDMGVEYVEWLSVLDNRTCPRCAARHGKVYLLSEVLGLLPLHPRCRCTVVAADGPGASRSIQSAEVPDYDAYPPSAEPEDDLALKLPFEYTRFQWDDANREHIAEREIAPEEVEQVVKNLKGYKRGYSKGGENRWVIQGETDMGRKLTVTVTPRDGELRPVNARPSKKMPKGMQKD